MAVEGEVTTIRGGEIKQLLVTEQVLIILGDAGMNLIMMRGGRIGGHGWTGSRDGR